MGKLALFLFVVGTFQSSIAQGNKKNQETDIVSHHVELGETVRTISKKYLVDPVEIYKLNKFAVDGISQGMVLQIPIPRKEVHQEEEAASENIERSSETNAYNDNPTRNKQNAPVAIPPVEGTDTAYPSEHVVTAGETLYSLSRLYKVSVNDIKAANEGLAKGLKVGQVIKIPASTGNIIKAEPFKAVVNEPTSASNQTAQQNVITHTVEPKETLYSLSKKYGVTVDQIKSQNPEVQKHGLQIGQILTITKN